MGVPDFWVDIENSAGVRYGDGPIITVEWWEQKERLDRAGEFKFSMPASDPRAALAQHKRVARCWGIVEGALTEIGAGIIDRISVTTDARGAVSLEVSGDDLLVELTNTSVGFLELTDGVGGGVATALASVMATAPAGWSLDIVNGYAATTGNVYGAFAGELTLSALITLTKRTGEHFRRGVGRTVVWLRNDQPSSGMTAVQDGESVSLDSNPKAMIIKTLNRVQDSFGIVTRIYPYGSGTGKARLTLAAVTDAAPAGYTRSIPSNYIEQDASTTAYGLIARYMSFKDIAPISNTDADFASAANALQAATVEYLARYAQPEAFYSLAVAARRAAVRPGETLFVDYFQAVDGYTEIDISQDLLALEVSRRIDASGLQVAGLQVATVDRWPVKDLEIIAGQMAEGSIFEAHPQLNANSYVVSYREPMDDSAAASIDFWLGPEVARINQVVFRFRIDPLRSTVASADSGGSSSITDDGATWDNHSSTVQIGIDVDHYHNIGATHHWHSISIPAHTHAMIYGLFEEVAGNTLAETNLVYKVNGGGDLAANVVSIGGGWFELDITAEISDTTTFRPNQPTNQLVISTTTASKTALLTGQLVVRNIIQAIAVS